MNHRYDRTGERIDDEDEALPIGTHPAGCDRGWLPVEADVPAVAPCPVCRPALVARLNASREDPPR